MSTLTNKRTQATRWPSAGRAVSLCGKLIEGRLKGWALHLMSSAEPRPAASAFAIRVIMKNRKVIKNTKQ